MELKDLSDLKFDKNKYLVFGNNPNPEIKSLRNEFLKQYAKKINSKEEFKQQLTNIETGKVYLVGAGCYAQNILIIFNLTKAFNTFKNYLNTQGDSELYVIETNILESISTGFRDARLADNI